MIFWGGFKMGYSGKYKKVKGVWGKGHGQDCAGQPEM